MRVDGIFFFFKQKTAYEMRISDWSSDVCSSDLKIDALPAVKNMPQGIRKVVQGDQKWQAELINNFIIAVVSGLMLVFSTLVLLYRRFLSPLVNMSSLLLAPLGGLLGLAITGMEISMPVYIRSEEHTSELT